MKLKIRTPLLLGAIVILTVVLVALWPKRHATRASHFLNRLALAKAAPSPTLSFKTIAAEPFMPSAPLPEATPALRGSPACEKQWTSVVHATPGELASQIADRQFAFDPFCTQYEGDFKGIAQVLYSNCRINEETQKIEDLSSCRSWLVLYRAVLIDKMTAHETDYSKLSLPVLINKAIGRLSSQGEPAVPELRKMAEEIRRLAPDHPSTYKILAGLEMGDETGNAAHGAELCEEGLSKNPNDRELHQGWLYFKMVTKSLDIESYTRENPNDLDARYYLASSIWKKGRLDEARAILRDLAKRDPQSQQFASTLEKANKSTNPQEQIFYIQFSLSPDQW